MGKSEKTVDTDKEAGSDYEQKKKFCAVIAKPLADEKLCKKVYKLAKKASKRKQIRRGVKEVVKALRKNSKGWVSLPPAAAAGTRLLCSPLLRLLLMHFL